MKRFFATLLVLSICLSVLSAIPVQANRYGDFLEYEFTDDGIAITYCTPYAYDVVEIPESIQGEPVTSIESSVFKDCKGITEIILPDSLREIGDYAFSGCSGLTRITLPEGLTTIGRYAFSGCIALSEIRIPKSVTTIGDQAFYNCIALNGIEVDRKNAFFYGDTQGVLFNKDQTLLIRAPGNLKGDYIIPDSVTEIKPAAFERCYGLTGITLPEKLTAIADSTFSRCIFLKSVTFSEGLTSIGDSAFSGCQSLSSVVIPDSVTQMKESVFASCKGLTEVVLPSELQRIGEWLFSDCESLTQIIIPEGVTRIDDVAFLNCKSLTQITIPQNVTHIGQLAFANCTSLAKIYFYGNAPQFLNNSFKEVRASVFYHMGMEGWTDKVKQNYGGQLTWSEAHRYENGVCSICADVKKVLLTGTLTTGCDAKAVLTLTSKGEIVSSLTTVAGTYAMGQLNAGEYLLTVSTDCCIHREYSLMLTESETVLNLKLCHTGDINGDGKINIGDVVRSYAHTKSTATLNDYEVLCADLNGDGKLSVGDTAKLYKLIQHQF